MDDLRVLGGGLEKDPPRSTSGRPLATPVVTTPTGHAGSHCCSHSVCPTGHAGNHSPSSHSCMWGSRPPVLTKMHYIISSWSEGNPPWKLKARVGGEAPGSVQVLEAFMHHGKMTRRGELPRRPRRVLVKTYFAHHWWGGLGGGVRITPNMSLAPLLDLHLRLMLRNLILMCTWCYMGWRGWGVGRVGTTPEMSFAPLFDCHLHLMLRNLILADKGAKHCGTTRFLSKNNACWWYLKPMNCLFLLAGARGCESLDWKYRPVFTLHAGFWFCLCLCLGILGWVILQLSRFFPHLCCHCFPFCPPCVFHLVMPYLSLACLPFVSHLVWALRPHSWRHTCPFVFRVSPLGLVPLTCYQSTRV